MEGKWKAFDFLQPLDLQDSLSKAQMQNQVLSICYIS